jgi:predicted AlkP superfamily phosphohydrolase/phosphomutase
VDRDRRCAAALRGALILPAPVVLIGMDAADAGLVARGMDDDELPAIAALRARGLSGTIISPRALGDDGAWCSFATGVGPGRHGRRFQWHYPAGTYDWVPARVSAIPCPSFWGRLAEQGKRSVVFDLPKSPLGDGNGNVIVADWLAHHAHGNRVVVRGFPDGVSADAQMPRDGVVEPTWDCRHFGAGIVDPEGFLAALRRRGAARTRTFLDVLATDEFDAAIVVLGESHCAGHVAWGDDRVVLDAYRDVDAQVAQIVASAGADATVIVFSLLGMGPNRDGSYLLDAVLQRLDGKVRGWARRARSPDVRHRRYWVVPADLAATGIRCNVVGREPGGRVQPGADFDRVCDELRDALGELRDPATGALLVRDVLRADEIAPGPAPQDLADLHVVWDDTGPLNAASSPRIGEVRVDLPPLRPGNHVEGGWFVAAGPGITPGEITTAVSTLDFAPTVACLVGGQFECDGTPIAGLYSEP